MSKSDILHYLRFAAQVALDSEDKYKVRKACVGAIGFRTDGLLVHASNGGDQRNPNAGAHAETRLIRKINKGAPVIYVARVLRNDFTLGLARPCVTCLPRLKAIKVGLIYYSISDHEYGVIDFRLKEKTMNNNLCVKGVEDNQIDDALFIKCRFCINFQYRVRVWFGTEVNPKFDDFGYCCADYESIKDKKYIAYIPCQDISW